MYFLTFILFLNPVEKYNSADSVVIKIDLLSYLVILNF